ncbi:MAG: FAD-binding domain-containing protein [Myxococcota bacterium]|nr:FAD-binding domain-containing protein [Myxococcota bacterium]
MSCSVVWFKRDLRIHDHRPLLEASRRGPVICLYIYEPPVITAPDFHVQHLGFINESLAELRHEIRLLGGDLILRVGEATQVLNALHTQFRFEHLYSHEETGNAVTYARDIAVGKWAKTVGVQWQEFRQFGVFRRLTDRNGWAARWKRLMSQPEAATPTTLATIPEITPGELQSPERFNLSKHDDTDRQMGGMRWADEELNSFLNHRGEHYQSAMSSPNSAWTGCSRLSPHFAYGNISMRTVYQTLQRHRERHRRRRDGESGWPRSLASFEKRLHWHCHFIQKLESQPSLEFDNMASAYDGLRENAFDQSKFDAWTAGQTGYPMVDACMRALAATGWLNFRMRAMIVSFASYHLWLHWRETGLYLARQFLDYEPGIHYSQLQMQSGTTGINSVRIYSPIKQVLDHDPDGLFIKQWVPELAAIDPAYLAQPHRMSHDEQLRTGIVIGRDYPHPVVDHHTAVKAARQRIYAIRRRGDARKEAHDVFVRHGSRRRGRQNQFMRR